MGSFRNVLTFKKGMDDGIKELHRFLKRIGTIQNLMMAPHMKENFSLLPTPGRRGRDEGGDSKIMIHYG